MGRFRFIVRRVVQTIPLLLAVILLTFLLLQITPGDPARAIGGIRASDEVIEAIRIEHGLDKSAPRQFMTYVDNVLHGDLGQSSTTGVPVTDIIKNTYAPTLWILIVGTVLSLLIAVPIAIRVATNPDGPLDQLARILSLVALSLPMFWVGLALLIVIGLRFDFIPVGGYGESLGARIRSMILPGLTMAIALAPLLIRSMRASMTDVLDSDYISAARAAGVAPRRLVRRFMVRNALAPTITMLAVQLGFMLFGVVVIENTFAISGLGQQMIIASGRRDFLVIQGLTLVFAVAVIFVHLLADILVSLIDPRVEVG